MADQPKICKHCRKPIPENASICFRCKKAQGWLPARIESTGIYISILLVILSFLQLREATKQRNSADKAVQAASDALKVASSGAKEADKAKSEAKTAKDEAERARDEAKNTVNHLRTNVRLFLEMEQLTPVIVDEKYNPEKVRKVRQKLEEFAVPNEGERTKWLKSLD